MSRVTKILQKFWLNLISYLVVLNFDLINSSFAYKEKLLEPLENLVYLHKQLLKHFKITWKGKRTVVEL